MAKLNVKDRKKVAKAKAASSEFEPYPPGKYVGTLSDVEAKVSQAGNAYWNCTFTDIENMDGEAMPGRQWFMVMLPKDKMPADYKPGPKAKEQDPAKAWEIYQEIVAGRVKAFFEAFGYDLDSDTDEMLGEKAILKIGIETIQSGAKAGEKTNRVNDVLPLGDHEPGDDDEDDDEF